MFNTGFPKHWSTLRKLLFLRIMQGVAAVLQTVTGNAPITLTNAIAREIHSLTQTGLCTQADTPTPSDPVDIKCNNGALKMVDDELPSAYKRVLGFSMNNNSYFTIGTFQLKGSDTIKFSFAGKQAVNVLGCYNGTSASNNYSLYTVGTSGGYLRYGSNTYNSVVVEDKRYDVELTPTGSHGMQNDSTWTQKSFTSDVYFRVGTTSATATSSKFIGSLFGDIIVENASGERLHLIPCERVSDNELGYYDTVGDTFYEQDSTYNGAVSLGYDGSHYSLQTVGTAEVLTVSASGETDQTASVQSLLAVGDYADTQEIISGAITRKCGVLVLDGSESFWAKTADPYGAGIRNTAVGYLAGKTVMCSHYPFEPGISTSDSKNVVKNATGTFALRILVDETVIPDTTVPSTESLAAIKSYLAAQYAAGTPVIVVYPLAEATTESVAGQSLSTAAGTNVVSVTAEVSPIALEAEYYKAA